MEHLEKYGFEWENTGLQLKYDTELSIFKKKLIKTISMGNGIRKELFLDEQRITSVELDPSARTQSNTFVFRSNLLAYFKANAVVQRYFSTGTQTKDFTLLTKREKMVISDTIVHGKKIIIPEENCIVFRRENNWTALHLVLSTQTILLYEKEPDHVLVRKFYHDKRSTDWLGKLKFVREIPLVQNYRYCQVKTMGRKLYLYKSESSNNIIVLHHHLLDWLFPDKYSPTKGLSV